MKENVLELTELDFQKTVDESKKPVVVDFWAAWCGPCKMQSPVFHELAEELKDKAVFAKVNVDECEKIAYALNITAIPTVMVFVGGVVKEVNVGFSTKAKLSEMLIKYI